MKNAHLLAMILVCLVAAVSAPAQNVRYTYDAAGRLTRVDYGEGRSIGYAYDAAGNLLRREVGSSSVFTSVSAASFTPRAALAAEVIATGFGSGLATTTEAATQTPLPAELAGTRVEVTDSAGTTRAAPLFFVSPGQISYMIPEGTALGTANVRVRTGAGTTVGGVLEIEWRRPFLPPTRKGRAWRQRILCAWLPTGRARRS